MAADRGGGVVFRFVCLMVLAPCQQDRSSCDMAGVCTAPQSEHPIVNTYVRVSYH